MGQILETSKLVVFVIDDDPAVRNSLKFSLELEGFAITTYADGESLLAVGDFSRPQCLVIDYKLPGMSGTDLLAQLRRRGVNVPAVLITSNPSRALQSAAALAGVRIVEKPLLTNALIDSVRDICRPSRA